MRYPSTSIVLLSTAIFNFPLLTTAEADGLIVPFTSKLPACAADCGPLYDAQGACTPPNIAATSDSCFCAYSTLQPFLTTTSGVCDNACTTDATGLSDIRQWFLSFCGEATATTTSAAGATSTSSSSSGSSSKSTNNGWFANHWRWVVMLIVLFLAMVIGWVGACMLRRRILRNREKEFEMRPPVAWGPHQLQGMTGGYNSGNGVVAAGKVGAAPGKGGVMMSEKKGAPGPGGAKERNWLRKSRV